jgi:hypothetical protein
MKTSTGTVPVAGSADASATARSAVMAEGVVREQLADHGLRVILLWWYSFVHATR